MNKPYTTPILQLSIIDLEIDLTSFLLTSDLLKRTKNSIIITVKNAPTGSIKANAPLIIPIELPKENAKKKIIINNEYFLHGFATHKSNREMILTMFRLKPVDWYFIK